MPKIARATLIALFTAFPPLAASADPTSVYTKLDFDNNCMTLSTYEAGGTFSCGGHKGFPIIFSEGDLRQSLFFGHVGPWFRGADGGEAFVSFSPFNAAGDTIEWRLDDAGVPYATILRWNVNANGGDDTKPAHNVLVVSRVGQPGEAIACPVGYVDASATPDANVVARQVADELAASFACGSSEPQWHGTRPTDPPATMGYFPEPVE